MIEECGDWLWRMCGWGKETDGGRNLVAVISRFKGVLKCCVHEIESITNVVFKFKSDKNVQKHHKIECLSRTVQKSLPMAEPYDFV
jgi:hypothetical protein